jgi:hypothetical protein
LLEEEGPSKQRLRAAYVAGVDETIEEPKVTEYSDTQDFIDDLAEIVRHDDFSRFSTSTQNYVQREDEVKALANFLEKYGEQEDILGVPHFTYTFDDDLNLSSLAQEERSEVETEREFIEEVVDLGDNHVYGLIGKESSGTKTNPWVEITMRASNVEKYSAN